VKQHLDGREAASTAGLGSWAPAAASVNAIAADLTSRMPMSCPNLDATRAEAFVGGPRYDPQRGDMIEEPRSAGDPIPTNCQRIEVHVAELWQLFNAMDPSPFRERDLDTDAEEFIVGWARELPRDATLALVVYLDRPAGLAEEPAILRDAIREFFAARAETTRRRLRQLLRVGRTSLLIGVLFVAVTVVAGDLIAKALAGRHLGEVLRESLLIGGWVAMWRPLEVFLYDWWPVRQEAHLYDRLSAMPVRIVYKDDTKPDAWRSDWPAAAPAAKALADRKTASPPITTPPRPE
jgi:hypothetical protein